MFGKRFHLLTLLGFEVNVDLSWFLLAFLLAWSLAQGYFPAVIPDLPPGTALWLALAGTIGVFASIVFHEFAHALVARKFDMPVSGITLFLFGGVAHLCEEPPSARAEFFMAIAGPIASFSLALGFYVLLFVLFTGEAGRPLAALVAYFATINLVLATFNLIPAFPLDGGRVLRAAIWAWTGNLDRATRVCTFLGRGLGLALMVVGIAGIVTGDFAGGFWLGLIGFFIVSAAGSAQMQQDLKAELHGLEVRDIMNRHIVCVPPDITIAELVDGYFYQHLHDAFPVTRGERFLGCIRLKDLKTLPQEDWNRTHVSDLLSDDYEHWTVEPGTPVWEALDRMKKQDMDRLMVVERGRLRGLLTMHELMQYLTVRRELAKEGGGYTGVSHSGREKLNNS